MKHSGPAADLRFCTIALTPAITILATRKSDCSRAHHAITSGRSSGRIQPHRFLGHRPFVPAPRFAHTGKTDTSESVDVSPDVSPACVQNADCTAALGPCLTSTCAGSHCTAPVAVNPGSCDDGNACTVQDTCKKGMCVGSSMLVCNDGDLCTNDSCDLATGCTSTFNSVPCDDGDACTIADTCGLGQCGGTGVVCDDGNVCTTDACDATSGCSAAAISLPSACTDGNACTGPDSCAGSVCLGSSVPCDDKNPCTADSCNPISGCTFAGSNQGNACDDASACSENDVCASGSCSGTPLDCSDDDACTLDNCEPTVGCTQTKIAGCTPPVPIIGVQIDRVGRPLINHMLNNPLGLKDGSHDAAMDAWNAIADMALWSGNTAVLTQAMALFDSVDTVCGNQFLAGADYNPLALTFAEDRLYVNTQSTTCSTFLAVELSFFGTASTDCGGRKITYDVVDVLYSLLITGKSSGVGDGIDSPPWELWSQLSLVGVRVLRSVIAPLRHGPDGHPVSNAGAPQAGRAEHPRTGRRIHAVQMFISAQRGVCRGHRGLFGRPQRRRRQRGGRWRGW